jgi:hypothetical protein
VLRETLSPLSYGGFSTSSACRRLKDFSTYEVEPGKYPRISTLGFKGEVMPRRGLSSLDVKRIGSCLYEHGCSSYREYLFSGHWAQTKARFRASKFCRNRCYCCESERRQIHIHHRSYKRFGRERLGDFVELCDECHATIHEMLDRFQGSRPIDLYTAAKRLRRIVRSRGRRGAYRWAQEV